MNTPAHIFDELEDQELGQIINTLIGYPQTNSMAWQWITWLSHWLFP